MTSEGNAMLDAVGIISQNIENSLAFYKIFNLNFSSMGDGQHHEAETPKGVRIMIDSVDLIKRLHIDWKKPEGSGVVLCFRCENSGHVDSIFKKLCAAQGKSVREPWDAFWGQRYATVQDPDGYWIDLFADNV